MNSIVANIRRAIGCVAIATLVVAVTCRAEAASSCGKIRPQDQIFEINTRPTCCTTDAAKFAATVQVSQYVPTNACDRGQWQPSGLSVFCHTSSPGVVTLIYLHGNQIDPADARSRGLAVYRSLAAQACDDRPIRFVLWSWPSSKVPGLMKDYRVKACRTVNVGWQLAWVIDQLPPDAPVSLLGYSYGARAAGGAAEILAGGSTSGLCLSQRVHSCRMPLRVAFIAAASDAQWFAPGQYHGHAMQQIERLLLINNKLDPAMRYYFLLSKNSNPQAMGFEGPTGMQPGDCQRTRCYDASHCVGRSHDLHEYLSLSSTMRKVWYHLTYADLGGEAEEDNEEATSTESPTLAANGTIY